MVKLSDVPETACLLVLITAHFIAAIYSLGIAGPTWLYGKAIPENEWPQ